LIALISKGILATDADAIKLFAFKRNIIFEAETGEWTRRERGLKINIHVPFLRGQDRSTARM
jgi:hypothetical protein